MCKNCEKVYLYPSSTYLPTHMWGIIGKWQRVFFNIYTASSKNGLWKCLRHCCCYWCLPYFHPVVWVWGIKYIFFLHHHFRLFVRRPSKISDHADLHPESRVKQYLLWLDSCTLKADHCVHESRRTVKPKSSGLCSEKSRIWFICAMSSLLLSTASRDSQI